MAFANDAREICPSLPSHSHLDTCVGPPTEPRWGGTRPDITPARAAAIRQKRDWQAARGAGLFERAAPPSALQALAPRLNPFAWVVALPVLGELATHTVRLFAALVKVQESGHYDRTEATHAELGAAIGKSPRTARRAMAELCVRGYVHARSPVFVEHGAATSRRGTLWEVPPEVLGGIARVRASLAKDGQASGTVSSLEHEPSGLRQRPPEALADARRPRSSEHNGRPRAVDKSPEPASPVVESASRTVDFSAAAPAAAAAELVPGARQGETRNVSRTAPDGGRRGDVTSDVLDAELAACDDPDVAELMAYVRRTRTLVRCRDA